MARDGVAARFRFAATAIGCGGTLHYILQRTVVLDKVEVCGGDWLQGHTQIAGHAHGFEENFGKKHGGAPVQVDTAGMHLFHESAEEAEIEERGGAEAGAVGGGMHVRNVRADGQMNGDRDTLLVSGNENAGGGVFCFDDTAGEELAGGFAVADVEARGEFRNFVDVFAGFGGHAELARAEASFDVFGRVASESDFEIVNECGAVHGDAGDEAATHEVDEDGAESDFNYMAADAPEDGGALFARTMDCGEEMAQILCGENIRERI